MKNLVILIGHLGADPEIRYTQSGTAVASFSLATTERWKGKDGQMQEDTEWHKIVAWNNLAELCGEYLKKGSKIYCEGEIKTRKWQDQNNNDRYTTEIVMRELKFLSPKDQPGQQSYSQSGNDVPGPPDFGGTGEQVPF
jgi:single-strand DNA-binding protein